MRSLQNVDRVGLAAGRLGRAASGGEASRARGALWSNKLYKLYNNVGLLNNILPNKSKYL